MIAARCVSTVFGVMPRRLATARLPSPSTRSCATSRSRRVRGWAYGARPVGACLDERAQHEPATRSEKNGSRRASASTASTRRDADSDFEDVRAGAGGDRVADERLVLVHAEDADLRLRFSLRIWRIASTPVSSGSERSTTATSGRVRRARSSACRPVRASPTTATRGGLRAAPGSRVARRRGSRRPRSSAPAAPSPVGEGPPPSAAVLGTSVLALTGGHRGNL